MRCKMDNFEKTWQILGKELEKATKLRHELLIQQDLGYIVEADLTACNKKISYIKEKIATLKD